VKKKRRFPAGEKTPKGTPAKNPNQRGKMTAFPRGGKGLVYRLGEAEKKKLVCFREGGPSQDGRREKKNPQRKKGTGGSGPGHEHWKKGVPLNPEKKKSP